VTSRFPDDELALPLRQEVLPATVRTHAALVERLIGRPSHLSTHPSALVVAPRPLSSAMPLDRAPKGYPTTHYDGAALAKLGVPKLDLLGNRALSELDDVASLSGGVVFDESLDDAVTLESIGNAKTVGCQQLETPAMRALLCRLPIRRFDDVLAALALIRPAAAADDAKRLFVRLASGEGVPLDERPVLAALLPETQGVVLFEEDVISVIQRVVNVDAAAADEMRQAIVDGEDIGSDFLARAVANGRALEEAKAVWNELGKFAAYSFSKAHATSAALIAYRTAYAKVHHPVHFACAVLNHHGGSYPLRVIAGEMMRIGVHMLAPDVNRSEAACVVESGAVRVGLGAIKHLTLATRQRLMAARAVRPFDSIVDLQERASLRGRELEALVMCGACDGLPPLDAADYPFAHLALTSSAASAAGVPEPRSDALGGERLATYRALVRVHNELEYLGMHLRAHPLALLRGEAERAGCASTRDVCRELGRRIRFAGIVAATRRVRRDHTILEYITFEDEFGFLEAMLSHPASAIPAPSVDTPGPYLVEGTVRGRARCLYLDVIRLRPFHQRERPYAA
jgi:DNA polymerase III alpha subunit